MRLFLDRSVGQKLAAGAVLAVLLLGALVGAVRFQLNSLAEEQGGKLVFVGLVQDEIPLPDAEFHRRETTLFASRNATAEDFAHVIAALASGQVQLDAWITHRASPEQLVSDFANWTDPAYGVVKAMLEL